MASSAGGHAEAVLGDGPGGPHQQEGAGPHQAGPAESGPGRVLPPQHHYVGAVGLHH